MPDLNPKRKYYDVVLYVSPHAGDDESIMAPDGISTHAIIAAEIVEDTDMTGEEDWDRVLYNMSLAIQRRIRQSGWPKQEVPAELVTPQDTGGTSEPMLSTTTPAPLEPEAQPIDEAPEGAGMCWSCGSMMVVTTNRTICPQGCPENPPAADEAVEEEPELGADGPRSAPPSTVEVIRPDPSQDVELSIEDGSPERPYTPNAEGGPPSSFPQGPIQEPSD